MRFWDASALVPLFTLQSQTRQVIKIIKDDPEVLIWWASPIECTSAFARLLRENKIDEQSFNRICGRLGIFTQSVSEVLPSEEIRELSLRLLKVHPLRAADSAQLAAAVRAAEYRPSSLEFVCLDDRLNAAASREGFRILPEP